MSMLMPILTIAAAFIGGWAIALVIEVYVDSSKKLESEPNKRSYAGFRQKHSLWSFVLLLFAPLSLLRSLTPMSRQKSHLALTEQPNKSNDEKFCSSIG